MMTGTAFAGSWHCAGMCGPISLIQGKGRAQWVYQIGRLTSYLGLGSLAGFLGDRLLNNLEGFANSPVRWGILFVMAALLALSVWTLMGQSLETARFFLKLTRQIPSHLRPLAMGFITGLFPCGWLWLFVSGAAVTHSPFAGALVLFALWLGGLPSLLAFGALQGYFTRALPVRWRPAIALLLWLAGMWGLISRFLLS